MPASLTLAAPQAPVSLPAQGFPTYNRSGGVGVGGGSGDGSASDVASSGRGVRDRAVPRVTSSPYEEVECLGMVFECLVEACAESLEMGAW